MNILVIGNGFDLAHGLPTEYKKFLEWIVGEYKFFYTLKEENAKITNSMEQISLKIPENINGTEITQCVNHQEEVWNCIDNNVWIEYFLLTYTNREKEDKNGWIDFESEISNVIRSLDDDMISESASLEDSLVKCSNRFLNNKFCDDIDYNKPQFSTYRER